MNLKEIVKYVPGFRSNTKWKKIVASIYYLITILFLTSGIGLFLLFLSIPFIAFNVAPAIKTKQKKSILITCISVLFLILGMNLVPNTPANQATINNLKATKSPAKTAIIDPSPTITPTIAPTVSPTVAPTVAAQVATVAPEQSQKATQVPVNTPQPTQVATKAPEVKTPEPTKAPVINISASVDNPSPNQNATINVIINGPSSGNVSIICKYKSKDTPYSGSIGSNGKALIPVKIGRAASGFTVIIDVNVEYNGNTYSTQTSFTPQ